ncbi:MAG: haloalkane dehalogenase [Legionellales bacterium]|jgi:haloalkane dehalogenase|nr:haloalkane dehalogenase [Legionellales bacterium]
MEDLKLSKENEIIVASKKIDVHGENIHYLEAGTGDPIVFLHGMPTSSYLWRKIIPKVSNNGRCIAPDMIGMGQSDKPDIAYTIDDHILYMHQFISELGLQNITFVMHAWGSIIGFEYARKHPENVKGLVFYESHLKTNFSENELSLPVAEFVSMIKHETDLYKKIIDDNFLLTNFLKAGMLNNLSAEDYDVYCMPYKTKKSRRVLLQYVNELPFGNKANRVSDIVDVYSKFLLQSKIPKLLLYTIPGFTTSINTISWGRDELPNITVRGFGDGLHFAQETNASEFSLEFNAWYKGLK